MMFLLFSTAIPIFSQCPHNKVVGSNVGISTLSQALSSGVLTLNGSGEVIGNFCVDGLFDIVGKDFRDVNVVALAGSKITCTSSSPDGYLKWFWGSSLTSQGSSAIEFDGSYSAYGFGFCNISGFSNIKLQNQGGAIIGSSTVTNNTLIEIDNQSLLWNINSDFVESRIKAKNASILASTNGCSYTGNRGVGISLGLNCSYWGQDNTFSYFLIGLQCNTCMVFEEKDSDFVNNDFGIWMDNCSPEGSILNNDFNGSIVNGPMGIRLFNVENMIISENNIDLTCNPCSNLFGLFDTMGSNNQYLNNENNNPAQFFLSDDITLSNNIKMGQTSFFSCKRCNVLENIFNDDLAFNLKVSQSSDINCFSNSFNEDNENVIIEGGDFTTLKCNSFNSPNIGLKIPSFNSSLAGHVDLDIFDNQFRNCAVGMDIDVEIPQQVDKGNDFFNNSLGLDYSGPFTSGVPIFRVRDTPTELPAHNPNGAMSSVGAQTPVGECNTYPQINDPNTNNKCTGSDLAYKKKLIKALLSCYKPGQPITGKCHGYIKKALEMIKKCPNLLQDIQINILYEQIKNLDVAKLPEFYNVRKNIRVQKTNINFTPSLTLQPTLQDINALIAVSNQKSALDAVSNSIKNQKIADERSALGEVSLSSLTAVNYKMSLEWFLDYKAGLVPSLQRKAEIVALAEDCMEFGSPGQEVAHYMCGLLELVYNTPGECSETRRKIDNISNLKITPNPSSNFITIENGRADQILIFDMIGKMINNWSIHDEGIIDISNLSNGIYFIKTIEGGASHKFIKI